MAQSSISRANEKIILASTKQTVESYTRYLELIGPEQDEDLVSVYATELLKTVESDSLYFFNDLIPPDQRATNFEENLDPVLTYLNDIRSRYISGVSIVYSDFIYSPVFYDRSKQRLFIKVTANKKLHGEYHYKSQSEEAEFEELIDFYLSIQSNAAGVPVCKIFSSTLHENNEDLYAKVNVVEKSAPIYFTGLEVGSTFRRNTDQTINWEGGELLERLSLGVYSDGTLKYVIDSTFVNDNTYTFRLPSDLKPGKIPYYFQIKKLASKEDPFKSEEFYVKRRRPLMVTAGGAAIIAGAATYLIIKATEEKTITNEGFGSFPEPPDSPN